MLREGGDETTPWGRPGHKRRSGWNPGSAAGRWAWASPAVEGGGGEGVFWRGVHALKEVAIIAARCPERVGRFPLGWGRGPPGGACRGALELIVGRPPSQLARCTRSTAFESPLERSVQAVSSRRRLVSWAKVSVPAGERLDSKVARSPRIWGPPFVLPSRSSRRP